MDTFDGGGSHHSRLAVRDRVTVTVIPTRWDEVLARLALSACVET